MSVEWVDYGKTYGQLQQELEQSGESTVGLQVHLQPPQVPGSPGFMLSEGRYLIGDIESGGDVSGEYYSVITRHTVVRYRRLVNAEQLEG
jgi:hypothetical protein